METQEKQGKVQISRAAVAHVARDAALQSYGVVGLAPRNWLDKLRTLLRASHHPEGVHVHLHEEGITVDLYIIVQYGTRISEVAQGVMNQVKYAIEQTLGIPVLAINVHVKGLRINHDHQEE
ncbi:MAG: Asp23/Gls24 family envelope stress response protein [Chloroflexi bacterium]|nr:Asp23/Gls24 family envelope stress response protein [Chloroflexota bacterium]